MALPPPPPLSFPFSLSAGRLFGVAMVVVGGVVLAVSARYVRRATGVYRASDVSSLGAAAPGTLVRVTGTAQRGPADALRAPFSGRDCLALRYAVEERRLSPLLLPWFVTIHERAESTPFAIRTAAERVDVAAPARTVTLDRRTVATVAASEEPPVRVARFEAETAALASTTVWRALPSVLEGVGRRLSLGTRRYSEERATPGDDVTVVGRVTERGDGVDPLVVSDAPPNATVRRMARTSVVGVGIGVLAVLLGVAVLLA